MNCYIRTSIFLFVLLVLCSFTKKISARPTTDEIKDAVSNSQFNSTYTGGEKTIAKDVMGGEKTMVKEYDMDGEETLAKDDDMDGEKTVAKEYDMDGEETLAKEYDMDGEETVAKDDDMDGEKTVKVDDIIFTEEQWNELMHQNDTTRRKKRKAIKSSFSRWPNGIIPYVINENDFKWFEKMEIYLAMKEWQQHTCLRFRPAKNYDKHKIRIQNGHGCSSPVGWLGKEEQSIKLARDCRTKKIIIHEIGHTIGFYHEQSRSDRDKYVEIVRSNLIDIHKRNFDWKSTANFDVPYDYTSVMHYEPRYFSKGNSITIRTKDPYYQNIIGKAPGLSFLDIKLANKMYNCAGHCGNKVCPPFAFLDKNCNCICPGPSPYQPTRKCTEPRCFDFSNVCTEKKQYCFDRRYQRDMHENCPKTCGLCK